MAGKPQKYPKVTKRPRPRAEGTYWTLRWTEDGERREAPAELDGVVGYLSEDQAEEARGNKEAMLRLGLQPQETGLSRPWDVGDVLVAYLEHVARLRGGSRYARSQERHVLELCRYFGGRSAPRADRLRTADLEELAMWLSRQPGRKRGTTMARETVESRLAVLPRAYALARRAGHIDCDCPDMPRIRKLLPDDARPPRDLTEPELRAIIQAADASWEGFGDFLEFSAWQPRRPKAILAIRISDCSRLQEPGLQRDQRKIYFRADKAGVGRGWGPLTEPARRAALRQLERRLAQGAGPDDALWTNSSGAPLQYLRAWERLKLLTATEEPSGSRVARSGVVDVTLYDLRKHGVGQLFRHTYNLRAMLPHTGHRSLQTLLRYLATVGFDANDLAGQVDWSGPALRVVAGEEDDT